MRALLAAALVAAMAVPAAADDYNNVFLEKLRPSFVLATGTDDVTAARVSVPFIWDVVRADNTISSWTFAPVAGVRTTKDATYPDFGLTAFDLGAMVAYTRQAPLAIGEELAALGKMHDAIADIAVKLCGASNPQSIDASQLCPAGKAAVASLASMRVDRAHFPELEISAWGGFGAAQFKYYANTLRDQFALTNSWDWSVAGAAQLTYVPWSAGKPVGFTLEVPLYAKDAAQVITQTAGNCAQVGTIRVPGGANGDMLEPLTSCTSTYPIGTPARAGVFSAKAYVGIVDAEHAYWRVALGGGIVHDKSDDTNTWSIELPVYVNATALGGAKSLEAKAGGPVAADYDGIVRITPSLQRHDGEWSLFVNLELLGQRNLFSRADVLVK
ncbi:MAG TPA: hypothetical protein VGM88_22250 [Kofleriaceae bacterium]|jgi:hypothetical protein